MFCFAAAVCLLFSKHTLYLGFAFPGKLIIYLPINYCGFPHVLSMWEFVVLIGLMFLFPVLRNRSIHERPRFVLYYPALIVETFVVRSTGRGLRSAGYDICISLIDHYGVSYPVGLRRCHAVEQLKASPQSPWSEARPACPQRQ